MIRIASIRALAAAVVATLLLGLTSNSPALAEQSEPVQQWVETSLLAINAGPNKEGINQPHLTLQEVNRRRHGMYYARDSREFATRQRTTPSAAVDFWTECLNKTPKDVTRNWIKNHYEYCARGKIRVRYMGRDGNGLPMEKGKVIIPFIATALASKTERKVDVNFSFERDKIDRDGKQPTTYLTYTGFCEGYNGVDNRFGASNTCKIAGTANPGDSVTLKKSLNDWIRNPALDLHVSSDVAWVDEDPKAKAFGASEKVALANLGMSFKAEVPGWIPPPDPTYGWQTSVRFDSASYLNRTNGAVFYDTIPSLVYDYNDRTDPTPDPNGPGGVKYRGVHEVAKHIWEAWLNSDATIPDIRPASKYIPGSSNNLGDTLHRVYHKQKGPDGKEYDRKVKNRRKSTATCRQEIGSTPAGKECDEFPFAATYQGAAQHFFEPSVPAGQFSVRYISKHDNGEAGTRLGTWFSNDRILDWRHNGATGSDSLKDDFFVRILNAP